MTSDKFGDHYYGEPATVVEHLQDPYVYLTMRRGYATPGNPLNRPGWHCDDFGGTDLNYIWSDAYPTRVLSNTGKTGPWKIDPHDTWSMRNFEDIAGHLGYWTGKILDCPLKKLIRLTPYVIHAAPVIPAPGGMRSFFKISVSTHRYNLAGNSHNYLFDYAWPMHDRQTIRNQPQGELDYT